MQLPGGVLEGGERRRECSFHPASGALELALAEAGAQARNTPEAVTRALSLSLTSLGGATATPERVAALCVADRQFLMRELERHLGSEGGWLQGQCSECGARFDLHLDYAGLPVEEAGEGFPYAETQLGETRLRLRLPTGADQERLADLPPERARDWLLRRLAEDQELPERLEPDLVSAAEQALEAVAPTIVLTLQAGCPECGADNRVELDPYRVLGRGGDALLEQVHRIAVYYHWSEAEILGLPRGRRLRYLGLIDRARGLSE